MSTYSREDDLVVALREANTALVGSGQFKELILLGDEASAAAHVTQVADVFVRWLRRAVSIQLELVAIEQQDGSRPTTIPQGGKVTTIADNQQARYIVTADDARGFETSDTLGVTTSPTGVVTATLTLASAGTASGKDELLVKAVAPGTAVVTLTDSVNPTLTASDTVTVTAGPAAALTLGTPTIEALV